MSQPSRVRKGTKNAIIVTRKGTQRSSASGGNVSKVRKAKVKTKAKEKAKERAKAKARKVEETDAVIKNLAIPTQTWLFPS